MKPASLKEPCATTTSGAGRRRCTIRICCTTIPTSRPRAAGAAGRAAILPHCSGGWPRRRSCRCRPHPQFAPAVRRRRMVVLRSAHVCGGDMIINEKIPFDYVVKETKFAGPTCFQRGDNFYYNQNGERSPSSAPPPFAIAATGGRDGRADRRPKIRNGPTRRSRSSKSASSTGSRCCTTWVTEALVGRCEGRRPAARARLRPAHHRQLHDRMARLSVQHLGHDAPCAIEMDSASWASSRKWPA